MPIKNFENILRDIYIKGIGEYIFESPHPIKINEVSNIKELNDIDVQSLLEYKKPSKLQCTIDLSKIYI